MVETSKSGSGRAPAGQPAGATRPSFFVYGSSRSLDAGQRPSLFFGHLLPSRSPSISRPSFGPSITSWPKAKVLFVSIKSSLRRWHLCDKIQKGNALAEAEGQKDKRPLALTERLSWRSSG